MWRLVETPPYLRSWLTRTYVQFLISDTGTSESSMLRDEFILESGRLTFDSRSLYRLQITSPEDMSPCFVFRQLANHSGLTSIIAWCKYDKFCLWSIYLTCPWL
ncbi:uncharacterized protein BT62DRAFT_468509 [Guyanagaster necrorhizus]|uniref:Uncharacterized protein n=1 Tax=Guyanagaster necrorhizus TaxID=856835 RepID=A0A9P7VJZ1_9AGAR|nr:uncharacterized protein BT62DRAFT_468509 [Guyanagaster necrorhizus MCA 3950]KAG7441882.1 hypothetical protein BT62DRAFT_468509 [Guyanagaster necrorhizus MCA 3950]